MQMSWQVCRWFKKMSDIPQRHTSPVGRWVSLAHGDHKYHCIIAACSTDGSRLLHVRQKYAFRGAIVVFARIVRRICQKVFELLMQIVAEFGKCHLSTRLSDVIAADRCTCVLWSYAMGCLRVSQSC